MNAPWIEPYIELQAVIRAYIIAVRDRDLQTMARCTATWRAMVKEDFAPGRPAAHTRIGSINAKFLPH